MARRRTSPWLALRRKTDLPSSLSDIGQANEGHPDLYRAIESLKLDQREAFILVKVVGLTHVEAANALNKPAGTVKWLCAEAVRSLQLTLKEAYPHELAG